MNGYRQYMNRQAPSPQLMDRLLELEPGRSSRGPRPWRAWAAAAACCAIILGLWRLVPSLGLATPSGSSPNPGTVVGSSQENPVEQEEITKDYLVMPPEIHYADKSASMDLAASIAFPDGSYDVELGQEEIQGIFTSRQEESSAPKGEERDWREVLGWEDYVLTGRATYDGEGQLFWLHIWGEHPSGASFTLTLSPDHLPPNCLLEPGRQTNEVGGVAVTAWAESYDQDGDEETEHVCGSEFLAGDVGVRFENTDSPFGSEYDGQTDLAAGGARMLNALLVGYALEGEGLHLDGLLTNGDIPAWEEREFASLRQALGEAAFAPYLPQSEPAGYGDFYGRRSYQEGNYDILWVRWSRGYDDVEVLVRYPEDGQLPQTVDVENTEEYDLRRYSIPWSEHVPEAYRESVNFPVFRAQDMSQAVVEARGKEKDTGGLAFDFGVLFPNGVTVEYRCDGLSVQAVWKMVEGAINQGNL